MYIINYGFLIEGIIPFLKMYINKLGFMQKEQISHSNLICKRIKY
jgi:hypothetical protein